MIGALVAGIIVVTEPLDPVGDSGLLPRSVVEALTFTSWVVCAVTVALAAAGLMAVVPLRGHAWTYLAAAPAIASFTGVLLVAWRRWRDVTSSWLRPLVDLAMLSRHLVERRWRSTPPRAALAR
jgi:hypothetical protein